MIDTCCIKYSNAKDWGKKINEKEFPYVSKTKLANDDSIYITIKPSKIYTSNDTSTAGEVEFVKELLDEKLAQTGIIQSFKLTKFLSNKSSYKSKNGIFIQTFLACFFLKITYNKL